MSTDLYANIPLYFRGVRLGSGTDSTLHDFYDACNEVFEDGQNDAGIAQSEAAQSGSILESPHTITSGLLYHGVTNQEKNHD